MNCCDANGKCQQAHGCPVRETPVNYPHRTFAEAMREPCPAPIDLWVPTLAFLMGVGTGAGLLMLYFQGVV